MTEAAAPPEGPGPVVRRTRVLALVVAAVGVAVVLLAPDAPPSAHWLGERVGDGAVTADDARILARGVAHRYEYRSGNEAELLVLEYCSHVPCGPAVLVLDATADRMRDGGPWVLVPVGEEDVSVTATPAPLQVHGPGGDDEVRTMFTATYVARHAGWYLVVPLLGLALAGGGLGVAAARPGARVAIGGVVVGAAVLGTVVAWRESSWMLIVFTLPLYPLVLVAGIVTAGLALFKRRWDWTFALLLACLAYLAALYRTEGFYGFWGAGD